jgi:prepilin-type processing-associated H-X9-DG protein
MGGPVFNRPVEGVDDGRAGVSEYGVSGRSTRIGGYGVSGRSTRIGGYGVSGRCDRGIGVGGSSNSGTGVVGYSNSSVGVRGQSDSFAGVVGVSNSGWGVGGYSNRGNAAYLDGRVEITGDLNVSGIKNFKIDHPLDSSNKYLYHSSVESSDMKNVYDGVVVLDDKGEAEIELPDWFGALNKDFRYQLTAIGAPGPNLYIAEEISEAATTNNSSSSNNNNNSRFKIAGGTSGMKVSWQVTGIRKDPWANAHRIQVEEDKPDKERGYYLHPDLYGQPEENGISRLHFPKDKREEVLARAVQK